ncbi:hypothetical protein SKAU_G00025080 [Synaphobranchus kaupii]|uniref:Uncharacterized protein n=1 Tax=Synaphobranchus kaupii TaxID=118154 RepID=A0A9Q1GDV9_SYNKA|nr:hypothetical protein SKAU_G00025080 [Synaphobranchus kaupii]
MGKPLATSRFQSLPRNSVKPGPSGCDGPGGITHQRGTAGNELAAEAKQRQRPQAVPVASPPRGPDPRAPLLPGLHQPPRPAVISLLPRFSGARWNFRHRPAVGNPGDGSLCTANAQCPFVTKPWAVVSAQYKHSPAGRAYPTAGGRGNRAVPASACLLTFGKRPGC